MSRLPSLPSAPVEFNVLHDALEAGDDPVLAAAKAVAAGRGETIDEGAGLTGKKRDQLARIAKDEGVSHAEDATIPEIIAAIEAGRVSKLMGATGIEQAPPPPPTAESTTTEPAAPDGADGD
ncbi:hypothetical protein [Novosphingobium gossypii]|uniref:hypothetical protein n=1 Tax=Novosphingobium gossypii TaxID=1604774 RepID=UPI003D2031E1